MHLNVYEASATGLTMFLGTVRFFTADGVRMRETDTPAEVSNSVFMKTIMYLLTKQKLGLEDGMTPVYRFENFD